MQLPPRPPPTPPTTTHPPPKGCALRHATHKSQKVSMQLPPRPPPTPPTTTTTTLPLSHHPPIITKHFRILARNLHNPKGQCVATTQNPHPPHPPLPPPPPPSPHLSPTHHHQTFSHFSMQPTQPKRSVCSYHPDPHHTTLPPLPPPLPIHQYHQHPPTTTRHKQKDSHFSTQPTISQRSVCHGHPAATLGTQRSVCFKVLANLSSDTAVTLSDIHLVDRFCVVAVKSLALDLLSTNDNLNVMSGEG